MGVPLRVEDVAVFRLKKGPDGMVVERESGTMNWTPTPQQVGLHQVEIVVEINGHVIVPVAKWVIRVAK